MMRFDERDTMFSRMGLYPRTQRYTEYYRRCPEKKEIDDDIRCFMWNKMAKSMGKTPAQISRMMKTMGLVMRLSQLNPFKKKDTSSEMPMMNMDGSDSARALSEITSQIMKKSNVLHDVSRKKKPAKHKVNLPPEEMSVKIKEFIRLLGIEVSGIAKINPNFHYTHYGTLFGMKGDYGEKSQSQLQLCHCACRAS